MNAEPTLDALIDRYVDGTLTAEEMTRLAPDFSVGAAVEWRFPGP